MTTLCDFSHHLCSQVLFRPVQGPGNKVISSNAKWRMDVIGVWSTSCYISPQYGVTIMLKVPKGNNNAHWFHMVAFMAWGKAWRPAQVEEMTLQLEATRIQESVRRRYVETCPMQPRPGATNGWISRWVDDYKPWRICFMAATLLAWSCFPNVDSFCHRRPTRMVRLVRNLSRVADHGLAPYHSVNNGRIHKSPQIDFLHPLNPVVWVYNAVFYLFGRFWSRSWPFREVSFAAVCSPTYNSTRLAALSDDRRDPSRVSPKFQCFC